jgi:hypothetical protein
MVRAIYLADCTIQSCRVPRGPVPYRVPKRPALWLRPPRGCVTSAIKPRPTRLSRLQLKRQRAAVASLSPPPTIDGLPRWPRPPWPAGPSNRPFLTRLARLCRSINEIPVNFSSAVSSSCRARSNRTAGSARKTIGLVEPVASPDCQRHRAELGREAQHLVAIVIDCLGICPYLAPCMQGTTPMAYSVTVHYNDIEHVYYVVSSDIPGLHAESSSADELFDIASSVRLI